MKQAHPRCFGAGRGQADSDIKLEAPIGTRRCLLQQAGDDMRQAFVEVEAGRSVDVATDTLARLLYTGASQFSGSRQAPILATLSRALERFPEGVA
jgi:hypothetical protein